MIPNFAQLFTIWEVTSPMFGTKYLLARPFALDGQQQESAQVVLVDFRYAISQAEAIRDFERQRDERKENTTC